MGEPAEASAAAAVAQRTRLAALQGQDPRSTTDGRCVLDMYLSSGCCRCLWKRADVTAGLTER
jgi:hypothetical protein|eukprot:COSAG01_NODE_6782_length_3501_cov_2.333627_6_plen_63_part_00